jgi:hypothetical protein
MLSPIGLEIIQTQSIYALFGKERYKSYALLGWVLAWVGGFCFGRGYQMGKS